jgi:hypothetical protein
MTDKGWKSKGDKVPRRSIRQTGKACMGPFKAPRPVAKDKETDSCERYEHEIDYRLWDIEEVSHYRKYIY